MLSFASPCDCLVERCYLVVSIVRYRPDTWYVFSGPQFCHGCHLVQILNFQNIISESLFLKVIGCHRGPNRPNLLYASILQVSWVLMALRRDHRSYMQQLCFCPLSSSLLVPPSRSCSHRPQTKLKLVISRWKGWRTTSFPFEFGPTTQMRREFSHHQRDSQSRITRVSDSIRMLSFLPGELPCKVGIFESLGHHQKQVLISSKT